ncbi:MAG: enoyl-CoA hydratase/isomerase family protein [Saprospiraceae bacterium]
MEARNLIIEVADGIAVLTLNREKALNALNSAVLEALGAFFREDGPKTPDLRGVVITGAGEKAFAAGADITEFSGLDAAQGMAFARRGQAVFAAIERFHVPVVAAVNGFALGGGCELAMACHLRIAGAKARFGQPEVNLGLIPGYGGTQRLVQYVGKTKALELMLTADMIGADDALRLGLVNAVVPAGEEVTAARAMLLKIAAKAPVAVAKVIESVNAYFDSDANGYEAEIKAFGDCCATEDFREGANAFLEKRTPHFNGR